MEPEPPGCSSTRLMTIAESKEDRIQSDTSSDELVDVHEEPHTMMKYI